MGCDGEEPWRVKVRAVVRRKGPHGDGKSHHPHVTRRAGRSGRATGLGSLRVWRLAPYCVRR